MNSSTFFLTAYALSATLDSTYTREVRDVVVVTRLACLAGEEWQKKGISKDINGNEERRMEQ